VPEGSVVMFRSDWYKKWSDVKNFANAPFPGVKLDTLQFLHNERKILFHSHEPLDTDTMPTLEGEAWLMHNHFAQAEGVANLDQVPEADALIAIGFAKPKGGGGRLCALRRYLSAGLAVRRFRDRRARRAAAQAAVPSEARRQRSAGADALTVAPRTLLECLRPRPPAGPLF
jgi:putative cyclase